MNFSEFITMGLEGTGLLKSVADLAKSIKEVGGRDEPGSKEIIDAAAEALRDKVSELHDKYLELQQAALSMVESNASLVEKNRTLNEELAQLKKFDADRERYERVSLTLNTFAYRERGLHGSADTQPLLCPNCFDAHKKSYLSFKEYAPRSNEMKCTSCGTSVHVPRDDGPGRVGSVRARTFEGWDGL
ncbi:MAG: hypothetical protein ACOH2J_18280 [Allorhizobium sp.]